MSRTAYKKDLFISLFKKAYPSKDDMLWQYKKPGAITIYDIARKAEITEGYARQLTKDFLASEYGTSYENFLLESDKAYALQAAKSRTIIKGGEDMSTTIQKNKKGNENKMKEKRFNPQDMKLQDIQAMANEGKTMHDILSYYHAKEMDFTKFLDLNFGNDQQGRTQLIIKIVENGEKAKSKPVEKKEKAAPEKKAAPAPAPEEPKTLEGYIAQIAALQEKINSLEERVKKVTEDSDICKNALEKANELLNQANKTISDNEVLMGVIDETQKEIKESIKQLSEQANVALKASKRVRIDMNLQTRTIEQMGKVETNLSDEGWEDIYSKLRENDEEFTGWQLKLVARVNAMMKNHSDRDFEIHCENKELAKMIKK